MAWKRNTSNCFTFSLQGPWKRVSHSFLVTIAIGPVPLHLPFLSRSHYSPCLTANLTWWYHEPTHFDPVEKGRILLWHVRHRVTSENTKRSGYLQSVTTGVILSSYNMIRGIAHSSVALVVTVQGPLTRTLLFLYFFYFIFQITS